MINKILISESEKNEILTKHGLINEAVGDELLSLPNYSVEKTLQLGQATFNAGYKSVLEFKQDCLNTNKLFLKKKELNNLKSKLNSSWDYLAEKCMYQPDSTLVGSYDLYGSVPQNVKTESKVLIEYKKILESKKDEQLVRNKIPSMNEKQKEIANDFFSNYQNRKYCPNLITLFKGETFGSQDITRCIVNNDKFQFIHDYKKDGSLIGYSSIAKLFKVLEPKGKVDQNSYDKIEQYIQSLAGDLLKPSFVGDEEGTITFDVFPKNYSDVKKIYDYLETLSLDSEKLKGLVTYGSDYIRKWEEFLSTPENKKYCTIINRDPKVKNNQELDCVFDESKKNEPGKFYFRWEIIYGKIEIVYMTYNLREEDKNENVLSKILEHFKSNIPSGFERSVSFFQPFFISSFLSRNILDYTFTGLQVNFDSIKSFYDYITKMEDWISQKGYLNS